MPAYHKWNNNGQFLAAMSFGFLHELTWKDLLQVVESSSLNWRALTKCLRFYKFLPVARNVIILLWKYLGLKQCDGDILLRLCHKYNLSMFSWNMRQHNNIEKYISSKVRLPIFFLEEVLRCGTTMDQAGTTGPGSIVHCTEPILVELLGSGYRSLLGISTGNDEERAFR